MSTEFASAGLTAGQLNAIVKKLGGHDMALRFLRDELSVSTPSRSWREEDGVIYFSVESDGIFGEGWINRLVGDGFRFRCYARRALCSPDFKPTIGVTEVAVLRGTLFEYDNRVMNKICAEADKRNLLKPNIELSCLIRKRFTNKEIEAMGLHWIVAMHEPIYDSSTRLSFLLDAGGRDDDRWIGAYDVGFARKWGRRYGFAFAVSPPPPPPSSSQ